jgi:hypothetical protein
MHRQAFLENTGAMISTKLPEETHRHSQDKMQFWNGTGRMEASREALSTSEKAWERYTRLWCQVKDGGDNRLSSWLGTLTLLCPLNSA